MTASPYRAAAAPSPSTRRPRWRRALAVAASVALAVAGAAGFARHWRDSTERRAAASARARFSDAVRGTLDLLIASGESLSYLRVEVWADGAASAELLFLAERTLRERDVASLHLVVRHVDGSLRRAALGRYDHPVVRPNVWALTQRGGGLRGPKRSRGAS